MQQPWATAAQMQLLRGPAGDERTRGIFALPISLPSCNQFIQSSNVIFSCTSMNCPSEFLAETLQSSGEQDFSVKLRDTALKHAFPHHLRKSAQ